MKNATITVRPISADTPGRRRGLHRVTIGSPSAPELQTIFTAGREIQFLMKAFNHCGFRMPEKWRSRGDQTENYWILVIAFRNRTA